MSTLVLRVHRASQYCLEGSTHFALFGELHAHTQPLSQSITPIQEIQKAATVREYDTVRLDIPARYLGIPQANRLALALPGDVLELEFSSVRSTDDTGERIEYFIFEVKIVN